MSERAWIAELSADELAGWLKPPRADAPFGVVERPDDIDFPAPAEQIALTDWPRGCIFGEAFELKWEKRGAAYWVRLIGEREADAPFAEWMNLREARLETTHCFLWGRAERRIGRRLEFRAAPQGAGRLRLIRREFRRASDGALIAERLVGMQ